MRQCFVTISNIVIRESQQLPDHAFRYTPDLSATNLKVLPVKRCKTKQRDIIKDLEEGEKTWSSFPNAREAAEVEEFNLCNYFRYKEFIN